MLTSAQVRDAKPRATRYEIACDAMPGFIVRVLPTGKKVAFARFRDDDGKDTRHRLGLLGPGLTVDEARRQAMVIIAQRRVPTVAVAPDREPDRTTKARSRAAKALVDAPLQAEPAPLNSSKALTLRQFALRFDQEHIDMRVKPGTAKNYRYSLARYVLPVLGDRPLASITTADIQRFHNSLHKTPCAANNARCVLSALFSKAIKWGVLTGPNPVADVEQFEERSVERFLTPDERNALERVLVAAERIPLGKKGHIGPDGIAAIRLLILTGMRRDEIRDLRWEHVDWRRSMLRLADSKTGKRDVIVSDEVMDLLGRLAQAKGNPRHGLVVCSRQGNKLYSLGNTWGIVRRLAGIPDVRLHDLRHSVASDAIMNGVPLEVVGKMLGHRNYRTTQRYAHIADQVLRDAVNLTSKTIVDAARGRTKPAPTKRGRSVPRHRSSVA
jgi:integrase